MKKQFKLGVIGGGYDAFSLLRGVVLSDFIREKKIIVSDENEDALDEIENSLGVKTTLSNKFVAQNSEYLVLAVNPKEFTKVAETLEGVRPEKVISLMNGITKSQIKNALGVGLIKVARVVMNLPCFIGSGAIGIDMTDFNKSLDDTEFISKALSNVGRTVSLGEDNLNAVSALSGNGVYSLMFLDGLIDAGVNLGLSRNHAKILAVESVMGIAELVRREDKSIDDLVLQTCKENSSAIKSVKALQDGEFKKLISRAVSVCFSKDGEQ